MREYVERKVSSIMEEDGFVERVTVDLKVHLRSCPYCGKSGGVEHHITPEGEDLVYVECAGCGFQTKRYVTHEEAASRWNTQTGLHGKGCPLCGGKFRLEFPDYDEGEEDPDAEIEYIYKCRVCGASSPAFRDGSKEAKLWEKRARS